MMCSMFLPFGVLYYLYGVINDLRVVALLVTTWVVFYLFLHSFYQLMIHLIVLFVGSFYQITMSLILIVILLDQY